MLPDTAVVGLLFRKPTRVYFEVRFLPISRIDSQIKPICLPNLYVDSLGRTRFTCISSCNGLQLMKSAWLSVDQKYDIVCNPITKECKALNIPAHISKTRYVSASLAFDPFESPHYKVIFLWPPDDSYKRYYIEVYSSLTRTCKPPLSISCVEPLNYSDSRGIYCSGAVHWLSNSANLIIYFDLQSECIKKLSLPDIGKTCYFGEFQGHLHLVHEHWERSDGSLLYVFELKRDYSGWFLKYKVDLAFIANVLPQVVVQDVYRCSVFSIFCYEEEESHMVLLACNEWFAYNLQKKTTKRLGKCVLPMPYHSSSSRYYWSSAINLLRPSLAYDYPLFFLCP